MRPGSDNVDAPPASVYHHTDMNVLLISTYELGRQPFGGFGLSGLGTKAGGAEYLRHFTDPRVITENTMRRGFAPES